MLFAQQEKLLQDIESTSKTVRLLQVAARHDESGNALNQVAAEVKKLVLLRRQLKSLQSEHSNTLTGNQKINPNISSINNVHVSRGHHDKESTLQNLVEEGCPEHDECNQLEELTPSHDDLKPAINRLFHWLASADKDLNTLQWQTTKLNHSKNFFSYLQKHEKSLSQLKEMSSLQYGSQNYGCVLHRKSERAAMTDAEQSIYNEKYVNNKGLTKLAIQTHSNETELRAELGALRLVMEQKSIALIETSQQVNSLKLAAVESEATITKLSEKTHTLLLERDRLVDKISAQQTQTKGLIEKNKALTEENLKHSNALNELINVYIQEKSHMERNIVNLTQERDQLTNEASKLSKSLIQLQGAYSNLSDEKTIVMKETQKLNEDAIALKFSYSNIVEDNSIKDSEIKSLRAELELAKVNFEAAMHDFHSLSSEKNIVESEKRAVKALLEQQEDILRKSRASMLEANEELKDVRKHVQKWKSSAQMAAAQLSDKVSELDKTRKSLVKARSELSTSNASRKLLADGMKEKERYMSKLHQEIEELRRQLSRLQLEKDTVTENLVVLSSSKSQLAVEVEELKLHRSVLSILIPLVAVLFLYALM